MSKENLARLLGFNSLSYLLWIRHLNSSQSELLIGKKDIVDKKDFYRRTLKLMNKKKWEEALVL